MIPTLTLFGKTISVYSILALIGIFSGGIFACKKAKAKGYDDNDMIEFLLAGGFAALIGSHLLYAALNPALIMSFIRNLNQIQSITDFFDGLIMIFGGSVYYGGLLCGMVASTIYAYKKRFPLYEFADIVAPAVALMHAFGRIGCFLGGCCYGVQCSIGFTYTNSLIPQANGIRRFPIQLAESGFEFLLFFLLAFILKKKAFQNRLFFLYLFLYSIIRFLLEFFRDDSYRGFFLHLSTSQLISLFLFLFASAALLLTGKHKKIRLK